MSIVFRTDESINIGKGNVMCNTPSLFSKGRKKSKEEGWWG